MAGEKVRRNVMDAQRLASLLQRGVEHTLVIDSRTFSEYNSSHVLSSVNVCCSKLVKRRLQQDKVSIIDLLQPNSKIKTAMAGEKVRRNVMDAQRLASLLQRGVEHTLVIDSRTFSEYNSSHVLSSVNVCCSKLVKRRLQQDKVSVIDLLQPNSKIKMDVKRKQEVVVYDQSTWDASLLASDSFVHILLGKLNSNFHRVSLLTGKRPC
ncbi:UNVERIFIED_CONTAM: hypothetical protein FKN15_009964 [Acipenser sinensis]